MKVITQEWISKAEDDFSTVERECRARKRPNYGGACYHAQQCIEKYLKGALVESGLDFPKIHDLRALLRIVLPVFPEWKGLKADLVALNEFAVTIRYPGESADRDLARKARDCCRRARCQIRVSLGLDEGLF
jgi:HEPN domain-containing protein